MHSLNPSLGLAKFTFRLYRISSKRKQASFCFRHYSQRVRAEKEGEKCMSAFIVEDKTINYVVNWLRSNIGRLPITAAKLKHLNIDTNAPGWADDLGHTLFLLNRNAVDARYGDGAAAEFRTLDYRYQETAPVPLVQVFKSLQCWLYQCCEGDVPQTELYGLFDTDIREYLMTQIITQLPEYEEAYWG
jgi:hypothetical protein